jgi:hypothetical protein
VKRIGLSAPTETNPPYPTADASTDVVGKTIFTRKWYWEGSTVASISATWGAVLGPLGRGYLVPGWSWLVSEGVSDLVLKVFRVLDQGLAPIQAKM